jgi:hypothetical protein
MPCAAHNIVFFGSGLSMVESFLNPYLQSPWSVTHRPPPGSTITGSVGSPFGAPPTGAGGILAFRLMAVLFSSFFHLSTTPGLGSYGLTACLLPFSPGGEEGCHVTCFLP